MTNENPIVPPGSERRDAVREKAQKVKAKQTRAKMLRRGGITLVIVAGVAAIAFAVTSVVVPALNRPTLTPENLEDDGIVVADSDDLSPMVTSSLEATEPAAPEAERASSASAVSIRVYVDYLSEGSAQFEQTNSSQLAEWVAQGAADLSYHPVALLTAKSNGSKYSLRAAGAVACVRTHAPESALAFNHELLVEQPSVDSEGYTDKELAALAAAVGVDDTKAVRECIENEDFVTWASETTQRVLEEPLPDTEDVRLTGAPMILVNGRPYQGQLDDPAEFAQFVLTVSSEAYYSTASPTPTPAEEPEATEEPEPAPSETAEPEPTETPAE
ncbi:MULTISPECIES: DsbA family protein [Microbacterium]|uniref:Thioredoxin-like fold domain-containing protein n=1 Tax=Microbacterium barkeri TaxID=33917 RepID=A0A9W6H3V6_9MICO|nr:thioredoxin domain-containing protein [Microbacterium barkeri]MDI6943863.1 thioredoxin domain-containing protein [Microbacterium barkeri]MDR6876942.1 hypothetical protein [Microbacterium barkeri]GLJ61866.1 hypothetical protein GCM10017576_19960 [Microbacterium barkeri]